MYQPPEGFLKGLRELSDKNDLLLIFDEIQVGLGRTGKMFCFEHENVIPDAIILGKAISGGLVPVSVMVTNYQIDGYGFPAGSRRFHLRRLSAGVCRRRGGARCSRSKSICLRRRPRPARF